MRVSELMTVNVVTCDVDTTIGEASREMVAAGVGSVLVCDEEGLLGIFTERDVLRLVADRCPLESDRVGQHMHGRVMVVPPEAPVDEVAALMNEHRIRHVPVVDGRTPVGIVSLRDFFVAFGTAAIGIHAPSS
jgi:CBS domain-containing protein